MSILLASSLAIPPPPLDTSNKDDHIDIDEPWTYSYIPLSTDIIPYADTRAKLHRHTQNWRGITALTSTPSPYTPPIPVPVPPSDSRDTQIHLCTLLLTPVPPYLSLHSHLSIRPPSYAVHMVQSIKTQSFIMPYTSRITPSSSYL
ncbi:hypothetical protein BDQ17DRAFT_1437292 [Cyathus striatus]|nr:hypothetical protein BDQ17DRAFT_1437292 [Cyathus striatus]